MRALIDAALASPRLVLLALSLILIVGGITYRNIPKESQPDVPIPFVTGQGFQEGIPPEDAERLLVRPIEQAVRSIEGIKEVAGNAGQGYGAVTLEFEAGLDAERSLRAVQRKVDEVKGKLPADADEPRVMEYNAALFPVVSILLSGPLPERALTQVARVLRDELLGVEGVLEVNIGGGRDEMIEINIQPEKMERYGLSQDELFSLFSRNNRLITAGVLDNGTGRFAVKLPGTLETVEDVLSLPVKVSNGQVLRFGDVATVTRSFKDRSSYARHDGEPALTLEVTKRLGANIIETVAGVRAEVEKQRAFWPANLKVDYSQDNSEDIKAALVELQNGVLLAVILVVAVLILSIGWRSALLVAIAIPGSFLAGILALGLMGMTVNMVVLFGLIMAVGMLVDDAIIVGEYADRKMAEGLPPKEAYRDATHRMVWPIVASTATRLAMFVPLLFWPGIMGGFMKYLPITLVATLTASLLMAVVFLPVLGSIFGRAGSENKEELDNLAAAEIGDLSRIRGFTGGYLKLLAWCVDHPRKTFAIALALLMSIGVSYAQFNAGVEFFPKSEPSNVKVSVRARGDLAAAEKNAMVQQVEQALTGMDGVQSMYAQVGRNEGGRRAAPDEIGTINIELDEWNTRVPADYLMEEMRKRTFGIPGLLISIQAQEGGPGSGKPVQIELTTVLPLGVKQTNEKLAAAADAITEAMKKVGGFKDIEDTRPLSGIEWQVLVDRAEAAKFGADVTQVGTAVQMVTNGLLLGKTRPEDSEDEIDIRARYTADGRNLGQLSDLKITTQAGLVPINNFIERRAAQKGPTSRRAGGRRGLTLTANVAAGENVDKLVKALQQHFTDTPDPRVQDGVRVQFKGENEDQIEAMNFLSKAFIAGLLIMIAILLAQFNSLFQTALVLSSILFAIGAVLLGLLVLRAPLGIVMGGVGIISLAGIIVNNNIILIDAFNHLRATGMPLREALLRTGAMRLRPVLLTAGTAVLGLMPMVLGISLDFIDREVTLDAPGAQWWVQLASAVAGGLTFATPITLLLTPALLMWRGEKLEAKELRQAKHSSNLSTAS